MRDRDSVKFCNWCGGTVVGKFCSCSEFLAHRDRVLDGALAHLRSLEPRPNFTREVLPARHRPIAEAGIVARGALALAAICMGLAGLSQLVRLIAEAWR